MIILQGEKQKELEEALLSGKEDSLEVKIVSHLSTEKKIWSFVSSNEPVKNGCEVIYEMFHILKCGFEIK